MIPVSVPAPGPAAAGPELPEFPPGSDAPGLFPEPLPGPGAAVPSAGPDPGAGVPDGLSLPDGRPACVSSYGRVPSG